MVSLKFRALHIVDDTLVVRLGDLHRWRPHLYPFIVAILFTQMVAHGFDYPGAASESLCQRFHLTLTCVQGQTRDGIQSVVIDVLLPSMQLRIVVCLRALFIIGIFTVACLLHHQHPHGIRYVAASLQLIGVISSPSSWL